MLQKKSPNTHYKMLLSGLLTALLISPSGWAQDTELDEFASAISDGAAQPQSSQNSQDQNQSESGSPKSEASKPEAQPADSKAVVDPDDDGEFEKIQVTGSHIKRANADGASPIQVIDRQSMERSGYNSVSDVLRDISASSFGASREQSGSAAAGSATVSLRGLGANKTLVLLNGKRLPLDAILGSVDLNLIPMAAVQRIEILKDGASATYGSDALGGVINIITFKDFNGTEITVQGNKTSQFQNGDSQQTSVITGASNSKSSIIAVLNYRNNQGFFSKDRPWTSGGVSPTGDPGAYRVGTGKWQPAPGCTTPLDQGGGNVTCAFDYTKFSSELPDINQLSGMTLFEYETDSGITLFGRLNASRRLIRWQFAPAPGTFAVDAGSPIPEFGGQAGQIRYRTLALGNRITEGETTSMGYQAGAKGDIGTGWEWEFTFDQNRVKDHQIGVSGYALSSELRRLIQSGEFNPLNGTGVEKLKDAFYQPWNTGLSENSQYELKLSGELFDLSGGAAAIAMGAVYTEDSYRTVNDHLSETGKVFSNGGSSGGGGRNAQSGYLELALPLFKRLEIQLAGRYDKFSDFGDTLNPKVGITFQVFDSLSLRASGGSGFMAPNLTDLYMAKSFGFPTFVDAVACAEQQRINEPGLPACKPQQYFVESGGNPNLREEKSVSYNIGAVFEPSPKFRISADLWRTDLSNVVALNYEQMMIAELNGVNLGQYGVTVNRDPVTKLLTDDGIVAPLQNLAKREISGLDVQMMLRSDWGLYLTVDHSVLFYFREEGFPGAGFRNSLGENGQPRWRNTSTLGFAKGGSNLSFLFRTIGANEQVVRGSGTIPDYTEIDFNYTQELFSKTQLSVGVQNLLATIPPLDGSDQNNRLNTSLYNPRGQVIFASIRQGF